jgi:hypothetical protein
MLKQLYMMIDNHIFFSRLDWMGILGLGDAMSGRLKSGIRLGSVFGRGLRLSRWQAVTLAVFGFFLLTSGVEIGISTPAEASGLCCPAGSQLSPPNFCYPLVGPPSLAFPCTITQRVVFDPIWGNLFPTIIQTQTQTGPPGSYGPSSGSSSGSHLGLYVNPSGPNTIGGLADGFALSGKGVGVTDTSGAFNGATAPGFHGSGGGGGIYGSTNVTPQLQLGGSLNYQRLSLNFDDGSSSRDDIYLFSGYFKYDSSDSYVQGNLTYGFVPAAVSNAATGGNGSFNSDIYTGDLKVGRIISLIDPSGGSHGAILTKAVPPAPSGYGLLLDLSAHGGYLSGLSNGFTDSTGFVFGSANVHFGDAGVSAKLQALVPAPGIVWKPYIEGTVDQWIGFKATQFIPAQGGIAADTLSLNEATTFIGGRLGVAAVTRSGWEFGAYAFDTESADLNLVGGTGYVKVRF